MAKLIRVAESTRRGWIPRSLNSASCRRRNKFSAWDRPRRPEEKNEEPGSVREELKYPFHDRTITVTHCGRICFGRRKINLSTVFAGQNVGVKEVSDKIWLVSFMDYGANLSVHPTLF